MCGICGFVSKDRITLDTLIEMNDTMYHRGPDDHGEEIYDLSHGFIVGMAQRRLSIMDLSPLGHQPMHSKDGNITIVFNGEIYNFLELRRKLNQYEFISTCDTEVILAAYMEWGQECIKYLDGMFAIAIFDRKKQELIMARDRIGKKPLYYLYKDQELYFASELKPIMKLLGEKKKINKNVLSRYIYHQYINAPNTIFENVYKLEPGSILTYKDGKISSEKYWDIKTIYNAQKGSRSITYQEAKEELKSLLMDAVKSRMVADVPLGCFLSGGYDSSLITALAQQSQIEPVNTFSIGFNEKEYNEAVYAKEIAQYLGTKHTELYIDEKDMLKVIDSIPVYYDEPFADSSQIPSMLVSKLARDKVTVALSGDGGDEFFCGYNIYSIIKKAQRLDMLGGAIKGIISLPVIQRANILSRLPLGVQMIVNNRDVETKTQFGPQLYFDLVNNMLLNGNEGKITYSIESAYKEKNWEERRMLLDMDTYLPGDILCKVDRASMKYSLETRCPILDTKVMEFAFSLPHSYKANKDTGKRILKDIVYDYIPRQMMERPKVGFAVPLDKWLRGTLKEQLLDVSGQELLERQGIFNPPFIKELLSIYFENGDMGPSSGKNYSKFIWSYFVFQKWYQQYME